MVIDVLDAGTVAQPCRGSGIGLKALLPSQCHLVLKQEAEPFGMFEGASLCSLFEFRGRTDQVRDGASEIISFQWK